MLADIALLLGLVVMNGAFALSEFAIVGSRRARLAQLADEGRAGATRALALAAEPTRFLSSVQVGITSIGILSGAVGEASLVGPLQAALVRVPVLAPVAEPFALGLMVVGLAYVSLLIGELVPKRLALANPERTATLIARPMQIIAAIGRPAVHLLSASTDAVVRLLGVTPTQRAHVTVEEIRVLVEQGAAEGTIEPGEREMVTNVLNLDERYVGGVLTPRSEVVYLDIRDSMDRNREKLRQEPHEVLPVCDGGLQHVLGVVRVTRVLQEVLSGRDPDWPALAEPPLFVPESMTIMTLLEHFKRSSLQTALVVDEFGQVEGVVSLTDVVSSIVGDLPDDADEHPEIVERGDGSWLVDGGVDLDTVVRAVGGDEFLDGARPPYHTLGGFVMGALERIPRTGDVFERGRYRFEVVDMDGNRVDCVLVNRVTSTGP